MTGQKPRLRPSESPGLAGGLPPPPPPRLSKGLSKGLSKAPGPGPARRLELAQAWNPVWNLRGTCASRPQLLHLRPQIVARVGPRGRLAFVTFGLWPGGSLARPGLRENPDLLACLGEF